jgi:uncharacterized membrane protein YsdA (DUF1294 family)
MNGLFDGGSQVTLVLGFAGFLVLANALTYGAFAMDKSRAKRRAWRIPERVLLTLALIGGWPAAKFAQRSLRHKTRKEPFRTMLNIIGGFQLCLICIAISPVPVIGPLIDGAGALLSRFAPSEQEPSALPRRFGPGSGD